MIETAHWTTVRNETIISVAINALLPNAIIWALGAPAPAGFGGADGLCAAMTKGSGIATFVMSLLLSRVIRARVKNGGAPALASTDLPAPLKLLPANLALRSAILGVLAVIILVTIGSVVALVLNILPLTIGGFVIFNLLFGTLVGLTMGPVIVLRALADPVARS